MQLQSITPMLWVGDVRATIDYYVRTLGFDEVSHVAENGWGAVEKHFIKIMFMNPPAHLLFDKPQLTGSLYLSTDDADAWWEFLKERASIFYPIDNFEYGMREFAVKDCNGYILHFAQQNQ